MSNGETTNSTRDWGVMWGSLRDPERTANRWREQPDAVVAKLNGLKFADGEQPAIVELLATEQRRAIEYALKQRDALEARRAAALTVALAMVPTLAGALAWALQQHMVWPVACAVPFVACAVAAALRARMTVAVHNWPSARATVELLPDGITGNELKRVWLNGLMMSHVNVRADNNMLAAQLNAVVALLALAGLAFVLGTAATYFLSLVRLGSTVGV